MVFKRKQEYYSDDSDSDCDIIIEKCIQNSYKNNITYYSESDSESEYYTDSDEEYYSSEYEEVIRNKTNYTYKEKEVLSLNWFIYPLIGTGIYYFYKNKETIINKINYELYRVKNKNLL